MRRIVYSTLLFLLISLSAVAQNGGINFQGMARNAAGEALANQKISLRLSVLLNSESGTVEYSETKEVTTSGQGIFSVVVGDGNILTKTGNFSDINWKNSLKFLKVELDPSGGTNFALMGSSRLQAVPFAYYANGVDAENIQGTLPVAKGGTGVGSIAALKSSLGLDQVNNTADANKPLSTAAQAALETKVDKVSGKGLSANDYTSAEKSKLAAITGTNTGDQDLSGFATTIALDLKANNTDVTNSLATKVDKVTGKGLSANDYTTAEKTKLAAITGTNTGDQDLSGLATTAALAGKANTSDVTTSLATKVDKVTGKELSSNDYTTAEKTKLAAITGTNTGDQDLSGLATTAALAGKANTADVTSSLALKANTADVTNSLATKVDKVTGKGLSANDYTSAEKSKLAAITGTNTGDQDLSGFATTIALDLKANTTDVTSSLATKVDKVTGKGLSANDYTSAEKSKLAAITGTNTGDQDLSGFVTNIALDLKANVTDLTAGLSTKVDKIAGKGLSTTDFTQAEKDKLTAILGTNTGDQDLSGFATNIALDLKANVTDLSAGLSNKVDKILGKGLSSTDFTQEEKDKLTAITGINTGDQDLSGLATTIDLDLKANAVDVTTGLSTKVDKITGKGLSSTDFTQAEKTKLGLITGTNTGDQDLSSLATKAELEDDYAKLDEENSFSEDQFFESRINFTDQNNSSIRAFNYEGYPGGIMISNDQLIFIGRGEDDPEEFEGWSFNVGEGTLKFPDGKTEMEQDGNVFYIDSENDLFLTSGLENEEGKWGTIGMSSYEQLFLEIFNANSMQEAGISLFHEDGDEIDMEVKIYNSEKYWRFGPAGTLVFPNNSEIGDNDERFFIFSENEIDIYSDGIVYITGEEEVDIDSEGEIDIDSDEEINIDSKSFIRIDSEASSSDDADLSRIRLDYEAGIELFVRNDGDDWEWIFETDGTLTFPDNTRLGDSEGTFRIRSPNALVLMGDLDDEDVGPSIAISPPTSFFSEFMEVEDTEGNIFITTANFDENMDEYILKTWKFGEEGILTFPDGTGIGTIPGLFGDSEDPNFSIFSSNGIVLGGRIMSENPKYGIIAISPTAGFDGIGDDSDVDSEGSIFIKTGDADEEISNTWKFDINGSLIFPDGTFFGEIEGDTTIGFETEENSDFILMTRNDDDDSFEWQFTNDGVFKLPDGGDIQDSNGNSVLGRFKTEEFYIDWDYDSDTYWTTFGTGIDDQVPYRDGDVDTEFDLVFVLEQEPLDPENLTIYLNGMRIPKKFFPFDGNQFSQDPEDLYSFNEGEVSLHIFKIFGDWLDSGPIGPSLIITIDYQY